MMSIVVQTVHASSWYHSNQLVYTCTWSGVVTMYLSFAQKFVAHLSSAGQLNLTVYGKTMYDCRYM